jgi:hypothetical protein
MEGTAPAVPNAFNWADDNAWLKICLSAMRPSNGAEELRRIFNFETKFSEKWLTYIGFGE